MKLQVVIMGAIGSMASMTVLLTVLKLVGVLATLSWWVVLSPVWFPWAVVALAGFCCGIQWVLANIERWVA